MLTRLHDDSNHMCPERAHAITSRITIEVPESRGNKNWVRNMSDVFRSDQNMELTCTQYVLYQEQNQAQSGSEGDFFQEKMIIGPRFIEGNVGVDGQGWRKVNTSSAAGSATYRQTLSRVGTEQHLRYTGCSTFYELGTPICRIRSIGMRKREL